MRKLIYQNEESIKAQLANLNEHREKALLVHSEFRKLNLFSIRSIDELAELISGSERYIKQRIIDDLPIQTVGKFSIKKEHAISALELPDLTQILTLIKDCNGFGSWKRMFVLDNSSITYNDTELQKYLDHLRVFVQSKTDERLAIAYNEAVKALNELQAAKREAGSPLLYRDMTLSKYFMVENDGVKERPEFYNQNFKRV